MSDSSDANFGFGASLEGKTLQNHYRIEKIVARGGMAWLYKATHLILQETMAVKLLYPQLAEHPKIRARFIDEAKIQFRLKHPHIVQVTDVIQDKGMIGSVMEWVDGEDAKHYITRRGEPLSIYEIWDVCQPILDALHYAHQLGLVHRDIKPANILLHWDGPRMTPKLSDFGIAKVASEANEGRTSTGATLGTMEYMAPEQIQDSKRVDVRADIYSLGVTLYHMATGALPFRGGPEVLLYKQIYEEPPPPIEMVPDLSPKLNDIILRCLHKSADMRFQNCMELSFALSSLVSQGSQDGLAFKPTLDLPNFDKKGHLKRTTEDRPHVQLPTPDSFSLEDDVKGLPSGEAQAPRFPRTSSLYPMISSGSEEDEPPVKEAQDHNKVTMFLEGDSEQSSAEEPNSRNYRGGIVFLVILLMAVGGWWLFRSKDSKDTQPGNLALQNNNNLSGKPDPPNIRPIGTPDTRPKGRTTSKAGCKDGERAPCYSGPPKTMGQGVCKMGHKICRDGVYGSCLGEVKPLPLEKCNNRDDDCDGIIDEDFSRKGRSCSRQLGACTFVGTWQCHRNQSKLRCRTKGRLRNKQATAVKFVLRPRGQRFTMKFGSHRMYVRNSTCLELTTKAFVSFGAAGYQICGFIVRPQRRTMRLYLKRQAILDLPPDYCASR